MKFVATKTANQLNLHALQNRKDSIRGYVFRFTPALKADIQRTGCDARWEPP